MAIKSSRLVGRAKTMAKNGSTYLAFSLLNRLIPFLLLPILTRHIDPEGFGIVAVIGVVTALVMPVVGMCSNSVLAQRYFKMGATARSGFINDSYKIILGNSIFLCLVVIPFAPLINTYLKISLGWFEVAILSATAGMVITITTSLLQLKKEAASFGIFQTIFMLANVGLSLLLVVVLGMAWQGRVWAILISSLLVACWAVYWNLRSGDIDLSQLQQSKQISTIYRLGGMLIPSTVAGWVIAMSDRVFLTSMTTLELVGIYAVGMMLGQITEIFLTALGRAYQPYFFQHGDSDNEEMRVRIVQGVYAVVVVSLLTALVVILIAPVIMSVMIDVRYHAANQIVGWLCLAFALRNIGGVFQNLVMVVEKNAVTVYVSGATLLVSLLGNYYLIDHFGIIGAAIGNALSAFTFMLLLIVASLRYNQMPWFDKRVLRISF